MAKTSTVFVCSNCGTESPKWFGKCPGCNSWNTCYEEKITSKQGTKSKDLKVAKPEVLHSIKSQDINRVSTGFLELDRVLGGGLVKGSLILLRWRTWNWKINFNFANM